MGVFRAWGKGTILIVMEMGIHCYTGYFGDSGGVRGWGLGDAVVSPIPFAAFQDTCFELGYDILADLDFATFQVSR